MDKICKYYKYQKYVSYDNGATWQPLNEYQKGELMQFNSEDCGGGIGTLYKWVVVDGEYECNGYDKYQKTQKYVSYDNGVTYNPVSPAVYSIGVLIENNSADCGYIPTPTAGTKWIASYQNSYGSYTTKSKECDNTIIDSNEVPHSVNQTEIGIDEYTYLIKSVSIGECVKWIGYPDTSDGSFQNFDTLTSVTIPNSVRTINNYAFSGCHSLTGVTIPNSVLAIGYAAFNSCYSIQNVVIPNSVVNVAPPQGQNVDHNGVFGNCSALTSCTLSANMTRIPENMFRSSGLLSIDIPNNITGIGDEAFFQCDGITSVTIPNTVSELGDSVFMFCDNLRNVSLPNSITYIPYSTFNGCSSLTNIIIPNSVTRIGSSAFYYCNLSSINIPSGVTFIGDEAFARNSGMTSVTVNAITPPTLGSKVFDYTNNCPIYVPCESVSSYINSWRSLSARIRGIEPCNLEMMVYVTYIDGSRDDYVKYCDDTDTSIYIPDDGSAETVTYGDCVTSIDNRAFENRYNLKSVTISNSVTSIGESAFYKCSSLSSVTIGNSVTSIGENAFYECISLSSVTIPDSVTSIGRNAFYNCTSLSSVTIGSGVTSISYYAFGYSKDITSITINAVTPPTLATNAFYGLYSYIIYVPAASLNAYKTASVWSDYASRIQPIPNS